MEEINVKDTEIIEDSDYLDLEVKQSQIPNTGEGLYAKKEFWEDEIIAEYRGKIINSKYCNHKIYCWENKMVWINDNYCVIGNNIASKTNDIVDFNLDYYGTTDYFEWIEKKQFPTIEGLQYNATIDVIRNKVFLKATQSIKKGEEIFIAYGFEYWQHFYEETYKQQEQKKQENRKQEEEISPNTN